MAWTPVKGIQIQTKHIPGNLNIKAESLSRKDTVIRPELILNHHNFNQIGHLWHPVILDLFLQQS